MGLSAGRLGVAAPVAALLAATACGSAERPPAGEARHAPGAGVAAPAVPTTPAAPAAPATAVTLVTSPAVLAALEGAGFDLGSLAFGGPARSLAELAARPRFQVVRSTLLAELAAARRADPALGVGMRYSHRLFDPRWLEDPAVHFELAAVVPRPDRQPFAPEHCGELRFVYRLAYSREVEGVVVASRLPMTVNVVHFVEPEGPGACAPAARRLLRPGGADELAFLRGAGGPLSAAGLAALRLKSVEVNLQTVRWPSTVRPGLGGHAEYLLAVFRPSPSPPGLEAAPLENTVDVERLSRDPRARGALLDWLREPGQLARLDAGIATLPESFLARRAISVAPHGLARRANRPLSAVLAPRDLAGLPLGDHPGLATPRGLLRRLDTLSCPGCHQSRSIAGFHLLGEEPAGARVDALAAPTSPHLVEDLPRRAAWVEAVAAGRPPSPARPSPERGASEGGPGAHCGLGDAAFSAWTCGAGLVCVAAGDDEVGICVSAGPRAVGDACERGRVRGGPDPRRDRMEPLPVDVCAADRPCEASAVGFPGGLCAGSCEDLPGGAACGGIPLLTDFNACLARREPFARCVGAHVRPGALRACDATLPCRDDLVCAALPGGGGGCMPPYFLFQLRVDGHPG